MRSIWFIPLFISQIGFGQDTLVTATTTEIATPYDFSQDSIALLLIQPEFTTIWGLPYLATATTLSSSLTWTFAATCYVNQWPPYVYDWVTVPTFAFYTITVTATPCGDTYFDNGQLSSHIECVDSVYHGKAIYYDETGHKTSEYTYHTGHAIKSKYYDSRGRITSMYHYDFDYNNHGICVDYDYENSTKTITHYEHGLKHGLYQRFEYDVLIREEIYDQDNLTEEKDYYAAGSTLYFQRIYENGSTLEEKTFAENGTLIYHDKKNENGYREFIRAWDESGILIRNESYTNGQPDGEWLTNYNPEINKKELSFWEPNKLLRKEIWQDNVLRAETVFPDNKKTAHTTWNASGVKTYEKICDSTGTSYTEKQWSENGKLIHHLTTTIRASSITAITGIFVNPHVLIGTGFYFDEDTLFVFDAGLTPSSKIPISRWVIYGDDTLRQDYFLNNQYPIDSKVLARNYFVYNATTQTYQKNGVWSTYEQNQLSQVITYKNGIKEGKAVYYKISDQPYNLNALGFPENELPTVFETGYFVNDLRVLAWVQYKNNNKLTYWYEYGQINGIFTEQDSTGTIIRNGSYTENLLSGPYTEFFTDGSIKLTGDYLDGKKTGWWKFYNENGELILEGEYENDVRIKKWFEYTPDKKGELEKNKVAYS